MDSTLVLQSLMRTYYMLKYLYIFSYSYTYTRCGCQPVLYVLYVQYGGSDNRRSKPSDHTSLATCAVMLVRILTQQIVFQFLPAHLHHALMGHVFYLRHHLGGRCSYLIYMYAILISAAVMC